MQSIIDLSPFDWAVYEAAIRRLTVKNRAAKDQRSGHIVYVVAFFIKTKVSNILCKTAAEIKQNCRGSDEKSNFTRFAAVQNKTESETENTLGLKYGRLNIQILQCTFKESYFYPSFWKRDIKKHL